MNNYLNGNKTLGGGGEKAVRGFGKREKGERSVGKRRKRRGFGAILIVFVYSGFFGNIGFDRLLE